VAARATLSPPRSVDDELRDILRRVRPSPAELLSVWPTARRAHVVLVVRVDQVGEASISARQRERAAGDGDPELARRLRRLGRAIPVIFERPEGTTVASLSALTSDR
jgi:hypothetical protein